MSPFPVLFLTERDRSCLANGSSFFHTVGNILSLCLVIFVLQTPEQTDPAGANLLTQVHSMTLAVWGFLSLVFHMVGFLFAMDSWSFRTRWESPRKLFLFNLVGGGFLLLGLYFSIASGLYTAQYQTLVLESFSKGMQKYWENENSKRNVDDFQLRHQCCGLENSLDWLTKFAKERPVQIAGISVGCRNYNVTSLACQFPRSCCKWKHLKCPSEFFPSASPANWSDFLAEVKEQTPHFNHDRHCKGIVSSMKIILDVPMYFCVILLILQLCSLCLDRLLETSSQMAFKLGVLNGLSPGWVIGRGDQGQLVERAKNKLLGEVVGRRRKELETLLLNAGKKTWETLKEETWARIRTRHMAYWWHILTEDEEELESINDDQPWLLPESEALDQAPPDNIAHSYSSLKSSLKSI